MNLSHRIDSKSGSDCCHRSNSNSDCDSTIFISFEWLVSIALWLGVFSYVALFPYMMTIFGISDPVNRIKRLLKRITRDRILNYIKANLKVYETSTKKDPVQPIVDIIYGSVRIHDLDTTGVGLKGIVEQAIKIINCDVEEGISRYFCYHLRRVGIFAAGIADEESIIEVIDNLETFGKSTVSKDLKYAPWKQHWLLVLLEKLR